mgnify:CR=1 FL=1
MNDNLKTIRELADELGVFKAGYMESRTACEDPAVRSTDSINRDVEKR